MITFTQGNLLEARAEALVNTVNTVGIMGKGIALMFKERFPENFRLYAAACKAGAVRTGKMFVTEPNEIDGPRWIINFPTKRHWRSDSRISWIDEGLTDLRRFLVHNGVKSVAVPPLGAGSGGLNWRDVRRHIEASLGGLNTDVLVYEPTPKYQNVAKKKGVEELTPARALMAELVRRYWVLGMECSLLEIQKLAWFLERAILHFALSENPLKLKFIAHKYGPYAKRLTYVLDALDGSYLHCDKRISDAGPTDVIWFDEGRNEYLKAYLKSECQPYAAALESTAARIDGFETPYGMELLATIDWLLVRENVSPTASAMREGLARWPGGGAAAAERKLRLFDERAVTIALERLTSS